MRTARRLLAATAALALLATFAVASGLGAAEPYELTIKMVGGVVQVTDTDTNSGYVFVLSDKKIILDSDSGGYNIGAGCAKGPGQVVHPGYDHTDEYVVCAGWDGRLIRGDMGEGWDYIDQRDAPATLRSEFDLGGDGDYYYGGPGVDVAHGGADEDELEGGAGNDELYGDGEFDIIYGSTGSDFLDGGDDEDYLDYSNYDGAIVVDISNGNGTVKKATGTDQVRNIEGLVDTAKNDKLTVQGSAGEVFSLYANEGRDDIRSKGFASITTDNSGRDQVRAHQGNAKGARAGQDEIICTGGRPSRLEIDKGIDSTDGCERGQRARRSVGAVLGAGSSAPRGHH